MIPALVLVVGIASWMPARFGPDYVALPEGPGVSVRVCGAGACRVVTSTDAGPNLAMQRAGRVIDLSVSLFEDICGVSRRVGLCEVTVQYLGQTKRTPPAFKRSRGGPLLEYLDGSDPAPGNPAEHRCRKR